MPIDPRQKIVVALRKKAASWATKVDDKLRVRDMGTRRKFNQAMAARRDGYRMLQTGAVLTFLAKGLEAGALEPPLSTLRNVAQVENAVSIAARFGLDEAAIKQRDLQRSSLWSSAEIAGECGQASTMIGQLYADLALANPSQMVALIHQLRDIIEDSGCIDWDAEELLRRRGEVHLQKISGFVPTPPDLVDELLYHLNLQVGDRVLEPAAGDGAILERVRELFPGIRLHCCEINSDLNRILRLTGFEPECRDYFEWEPAENERPNKIAANPPFEGMEDIDFVYRMWEHLAPGGRLAAIMSNSYSFSTKKKAKEFRAWLETVPVIYEKENDRNAFRPSGYNILTRLLVLQKRE